MLSFNPIIRGASRHVASIEDRSGETKELIFFTERSRLEPDAAPTTFSKDLQKYIASGTPDDFKLKPEYLLNIVPSNEITGLQRETVSIFGKSGSGKSWQIKNYIRNYSLIHPGNQIYFYSMNKLANDPSYDESLRKKITQINLLSVDCAIDVERFQDSLIILDDVLDVKFSLSPVEVFGEEYQRANLTQKSKMERECKQKSESIRSFLNESVQNILNLGRKYNISCIAVYHKLRSGIHSTFAVEESSSCWLYPYTATKDALHGFLKQRLSFSKADLKQIEETEFFQYDFLYVNNAGKLFWFTPNRFKII